MHRQTPINSAFRGYSAGGTRAILREADDTKEMQEANADYMDEEEETKNIESPQNYGFTSVTMDGDKDDDGKLTDGAETFIWFIGGNRSFPVAAPIDDRRHRLRNLNKGDVAMYRTAKDRQQLHMVKDKDGKYVGTYLSNREDMTWRFALVPKPKDEQQGSKAQQQNQQGKRGQNNCLEDNVKSAMCFEETKDHHLLQHNLNTFEQKDDQTHIDHDKGHLIIKTDSITGYLEPNGNILFYINDDPTKSVLVAPDHVHILFKKFAFWVNKGGCFCSVRPVIAQDPDAG